VVAVRDEEWGRVVSEVQLRPELADGLLGIEQFSHVVVLFVMHQARFDAVTHLTRRPRDRPDMPLVGTFAQRARHRPSPIGVTTAELKRVEGASLFVRGLDAIDGTPVLDVKPHVPAFDCPGHARVRNG
jgi:tRNA-Thr(GGU) m(6)t(6)A37 methyltransferase TsaA